MRINEYNSLEEFTSEYTGVWNPSEHHWFGLDFKYEGVVYRLHTGSMYNETDTVLSDGRTALYGIYRLANKKTTDGKDYILLAEYADMNDLLECTEIGGHSFKKVIMDDSTEILGKD